METSNLLADRTHTTNEYPRFDDLVVLNQVISLPEATPHVEPITLHLPEESL